MKKPFYQDEFGKIYCEDCLSKEGLLSIQDNSIDLIVTSPPYNIGIDYDSYFDDLLWKDYFEWCSKWLKECYRVLKPDGRMALNHYLSFGNAKKRLSPISELNLISEKIGFKHHSIAVWTDRTLANKTAWGSFQSASAPYINCPFEGILIMFKERWKKDEKGVSDISKEEFVKLSHGAWDVRTETRGLTKANFSKDFAEKCIKLLSYQEAIVLDPFMGSGTVAVVCKENKRQYVGFEISEKYCEIIKNRLSFQELNV